MTSDFPEFDQAYRTVLVKDLEDKFEQLAAAANFNIYHSDIWRGTARRFAESIVLECINIVKPTEHHEAWAQSYVGGVDGLDLLESKILEIKKHFKLEHD